MLKHKGEICFPPNLLPLRRDDIAFYVGPFKCCFGKSWWAEMVSLNVSFGCLWRSSAGISKRGAKKLNAELVMILGAVTSQWQMLDIVLNRPSENHFKKQYKRWVYHGHQNGTCRRMNFYWKEEVAYRNGYCCL